MPYGQLVITVVDAKNLKDTDIFSKSDPYVTLSIDKTHKQRTSTKQNAGKSASWNESFTFNVSEVSNELYLDASKTLFLYIPLKCLIPPHNRSKAVIDLRPVFESGHIEQRVGIKESNGRAAGEIHLILAFKNQGSTSSTGAIYPPTSGFKKTEHNQQSGYVTGLSPYQQPPSIGVNSSSSGYPLPGSGGFPDAGFYGGNPNAGFVQPPSSSPYNPPSPQHYGAQTTHQYSTSAYPSQEPEKSEKLEKPLSEGPGWMTTAGIAAGAAALGFVSGKKFEEHHKDHKLEPEKNKPEKYKEEPKNHRGDDSFWQ
ncbi:hypothetical protein G9A89_008941 [Geosiphon pyriformis]|nr:hypothetical protein G9A89_008941 [Geosiphon pyriformis]